MLTVILIWSTVWTYFGWKKNTLHNATYYAKYTNDVIGQNPRNSFVNHLRSSQVSNTGENI